MAPILLTSIISSSSEDPRFPAENLLKGQKWLSEAKDTSGNAVIELQLEKVSKIYYIDIGYSNVSTLKVSVGRSSWPARREYCAILSTVLLQTPQEARSGKDLTGCRMFNCPEHLNPQYANESWDRVRITLTQKFSKTKQIGLQFVRLASPRFSSENADQNLQNSEPSSDSWKNSPIARFTKTACQKPKELHDLRNKLLRISGTTENGSSDQNTLSRTAKMVLSSRAGNLTPRLSSPLTRREGNYNSLARKLSTSSLRTSDSTEISESSPKKQMGKITCHSNEDAKRQNIGNHTKIGPNTGIAKLSSTTVQIHKDSDVSTSSRRRQTSQKSPSPTTFKMKTNMLSPAKNGTGTLNKEHGGDTAESKSVDQTDKISVSPESSFTKSEVKRIKHLIQKFFNNLDMDQIDPDHITLRELRTSFEAVHGVQLDRDGRKYFRSITTEYLELMMTVRQHKGTSRDNSLLSEEGASTSGRKRKAEECLTVKSRRTSPTLDEPGTSSAGDCEIISAPREKNVQCPLCMGYFLPSIICDHAAVCGEEYEAGPSDIQTVDSDVEITSVSLPRREQAFPGESVLDFSDNMKLSEDEKRYWTNFSKKPKPYHPRMDKSLFQGCQLTKCPTCGQFYKAQEISEHSDECAERVYSGLEKRGLYYVRKDNGKVVKTPRWT